MNTNNGTSTVTESYRERIYICNSQEFDGTQVELAVTSQHHADLAGNVGSFHVIYPAPVPNDTQTGEYFILVEADSDKTVDELDAEGNNLTAVPLTVTRVEPNFINIPDAIFRSILVGQYDSDGDGGISMAEAAAVTGVVTIPPFSNVIDITGIQSFTRMVPKRVNTSSSWRRTAIRPWTSWTRKATT